MANAKSDEAGNETSQTIASKPDSDSCWYLLASVPHTGDVDKRRRNRCLRYTQQEANGDETSEVRARCRECNDSSPEKGVDRYIFSNWKSLDEDCGWVFPEKVSEVEDRRN